MQQADTQTAREPLGYAESLWNYFRGWRYPFFGTIFLYSLMVLGWVSLGGGLANPRTSITHLALGLLAAVFLLFGIFLINDAADRHVDARVHPDRPIPQGRAAWQHIMGTAVGLMLAACAVSLLVNRQSFAVAVAMTTYAFFFYGWAKGGLQAPGSSEILTPVVSALFPLYGLSVAGCSDARVILGTVGYIYLADLAQDLLGGIHDQRGDQAGNVRTFALAIGTHRTLRLSLGICVLATLAGGSLVAFGLAGPVYGAVLAALSVANFVLYARLFRAANAKPGDDPVVLAAADRTNHLAGMFYFLVSAAIFVDHVARRVMPR